MARADVKVTTDLDSSKMRAGLTRMQNGISGMVKSATGKLLALGAVITGLRALGGLGKLAMEAEEVDSKFRSVFKDSAPEMLAKIDDLRKHIHMTTTEMKNSLATYASMADGMGMNADASALFAQSMVKLTGDLASFHNLESEEAFIKIKSAIAGEFEPLKQLGIVLNQATVKQEALNLGIYDGTTALTASQKAVAVQSLLVTLMGDAIGDAEKTTDSSMNAYKRLNAELKELAEGIGILIIPAINGLVNLTSGMVDEIEMMNQASENSKSAFYEQAKANLVANGVLFKSLNMHLLTRKGMEEANVTYQDTKAVVKLVAEEIARLTEEHEKLNNTEGENDPETIRNGQIKADNLNQQISFIQQIIDAMGGLFKLQQDELRASDELIKNKKALLDLENQRVKAMDSADTNQSGVTTKVELRRERKRLTDLEKQKKRLRSKEMELQGFGGEAEARKTESTSRFGDSTLTNPSTRAGKVLKEFLEEREKLKQMQLAQMAMDKNLVGTPNTGMEIPNAIKPSPLNPNQLMPNQQPTDVLDQSKKGGGANDAEEGKNEKVVEVLEKIKEFSETTDTNIGEIKDLMDKIDGALT